MRGSTDAVSPIVATLLMVAITVVITAVVIAVFNRLGNTDDTEVAPVVMPTRDEAADRMVVIRADNGLPLSRLRIQMSVDGHFAYNALASSSGTALPANALVPLGGAALVAGGDAIYFCADAPSSDVRILLQDPESGKIVATETFLNLSQCT